MDDTARFQWPPGIVVAAALAVAAVTNTVVVLSDSRSGREGQVGLDTADLPLHSLRAGLDAAAGLRMRERGQ